MVDREKVIKGLECCAEAKCEVCPYEEQCFGEEICVCSPMAKDMLELLKAQEPRVMTPEELEALLDDKKYNAPVCLEEKYPVTTWDGGTLCIWTSARLVTEYYDVNVFYNRETYGKTWRAWTDWPSSAQREAVKWDGI